MTPELLFEHYRKTASTPVPRNAKYLEGMFCIRRRRTSPYAVGGHIQKASDGRQQFMVRDIDADHKTEWVAFAALLDDVILFHSSGDMHAVLNSLARNWQQEEATTKAGG